MQHWGRVGIRGRDWHDDIMKRRWQQDWSVDWINCCGESLAFSLGGVAGRNQVCNIGRLWKEGVFVPGRGAKKGHFMTDLGV